jgi:hypothetical protein
MGIRQMKNEGIAKRLVRVLHLGNRFNLSLLLSPLSTPILLNLFSELEPVWSFAPLHPLKDILSIKLLAISSINPNKCVTYHPG